MGLLLTCLLVHALIAELVSSPWWVPDLTLVGLVVAVGRSPSQWLIFSGIAGLFTLVWAIRFPLPGLVTYVLIGWVVQALARHWDATDVRVQCLMVGIASVAVTFGALWLNTLWSVSLLGLASAHVAMTSFAVLGVRPLSGVARVSSNRRFRGIRV